MILKITKLSVFDFICKIDIETNKTGSGSPELLTGDAYFYDFSLLLCVLRPALSSQGPGSAGTSLVLNSSIQKLAVKRK